MQRGIAAGMVFLVIFMATAIGFYTTWKAEQREMEIRFLQRARELDADQIRELVHAVTTATTTLEGEKTRAFLAGVSQAQSRPELSKIWHSGYDRGVEVTMEGQKVTEVYSEIKETPE